MNIKETLIYIKFVSLNIKKILVRIIPSFNDYRSKLSPVQCGPLRFQSSHKIYYIDPYHGMEHV